MNLPPPTTTVPSTSSSRTTWAARPAAVISAGGPRRLGDAGLDEQPTAGRSQSPAPATTPRWTSRPSAPPSRATRCSWSRASGGIRAISSVGTYGALTTSAGDPAAQVAGQRGVEVALEDPVRWQVAAGAGDGVRVDVRGVHLQAGYAGEQGRAERAGAAAQVDDDVAGREPGRRGPRTSAAERCRGTKTPGATATRSPQSSAYPTTSSSGVPDTRSRQHPRQLGVVRPRRRAAAAPRPPRTRTRRRGGWRPARRTAMVDDAPMPSVSTQITFIVVGYAVLVAVLALVVALRRGERPGWLDQMVWMLEALLVVRALAGLGAFSGDGPAVDVDVRRLPARVGVRAADRDAVDQGRPGVLVLGRGRGRRPRGRRGRRTPGDDAT